MDEVGQCFSAASEDHFRGSLEMGFPMFFHGKSHGFHCPAAGLAVCTLLLAPGDPGGCHGLPVPKSRLGDVLEKLIFQVWTLRILIVLER